jgi:BioD-like phosphotransacetylase family protein
MSVLLVTSDLPGAGKTSVALALAASAEKMGRKALVYKPFSKYEIDEDSRVFARLANPGLERWPQPVADPTKFGQLDDFLGSFASIGSTDETLTILELESSHGEEWVGRVAERLNAQTLIVTQARRGLRATDFSDWSDALGDRLVGVLVNGVTRFMGTEADDSLAPSFDEGGIDLIGMVPEDRALLSVTVDQIRSGLDGRYAVDEGDVDGPVEHFQVGCMSLDPGELRFGLHDSNAVVVRGDRPDIQMSALNASVACLVLTGGVDPIEYISYEAGEEEIPVMVVESDTLTTMSLLNDVTTSSRTDTAAKVARFSELLGVHTNLERVWSVL